MLGVIVACVYVLAARMSLALLTTGGVAVFWPAAGLSAGILIAMGPSARWGVAGGTVVATVVANLLGDRNIPSSIVFGLCNAAEALLVAGLIDRYFDVPFYLNKVRNVLGFLAAAIIAAGISGIGGAIGFAIFHDVTTPIYITWQNWLISDGIGIITVAPLVIGIASVAQDPPDLKETMEGTAAMLVLVVLVALAITLPGRSWTAVAPMILIFPILSWIAARCRPFFAAVAVFIVTLSVVWATTIGLGHFGDPDFPVADRVLAARVGILIVALYSYLMAAYFAANRATLSQLQ